MGRRVGRAASLGSAVNFSAWMAPCPSAAGRHAHTKRRMFLATACMDDDSLGVRLIGTCLWQSMDSAREYQTLCAAACCGRSSSLASVQLNNGSSIDR